MKQGSNSRRSRGRGNGKRPQKSHNFDSAGPEGRVRGNAQQVYEKYLALARDAMTAGDRIATENYFQHAEHYLRVLMAQDNSDGRVDAFRQRQRFGPFGVDEFDGDGDGDDDGEERPSDVSGNRAPQGERNFQGERNPQGEGRQHGETRNQGEGRPQGEPRHQQEGRPQRDSQREGQREGRPQGENRPPREPRDGRQHNQPRHQGEEGRAEASDAGREGARESGREGGRDRGGRDGGNGRRVPIEKPNDQNAQHTAEPKAAEGDHDIADDEGVRRTIAI